MPHVDIHPIQVKPSGLVIDSGVQIDLATGSQGRDRRKLYPASRDENLVL